MSEESDSIWPQKFQFDELNRIMIAHYQSETGVGISVFNLEDFSLRFDLYLSLSSTVQVRYGIVIEILFNELTNC